MITKSREINLETTRTVRLGQLTLADLVNDSKNWKLTGEFEVGSPYYDLTNPDNKDEFGELNLNDIVTIASYDENDIAQSHIDLTDLLVDYLQESNDYLVFMGLLQAIFDDIKSVADVFDQLADVESCVEIFLPKLSYLVNYKYNYNIPGYVNRDIIKRLLWLYEQKATDKDVLESADYGSNDQWVGSTLFLPNAKPEARTAELFYPVNSLFTHDVSAHSRTHRFPDDERWRGGVIIIKVKKLNKRIREAIRRVLPAGLKCYFDFDGSMYGDLPNGAVDFGSWCDDYTDTVLDYALIDRDQKTSQWFDGNYYDPHYFSGKQILFCDNILDYMRGISWLQPLPKDDPEDNVRHNLDDFTYEIPAPKRIWKGFATYSSKGPFSGKLRLEGEFNIHQVQVPLGPVLPNDIYYTVDVIEDLVVNPWITDSRYHQPYINNDKYAMNSFYDDPSHFKDYDLVETEPLKTTRFDEIVVEDNLVNDLLLKTYSNHFYLEDYCEPFVVYTDRLRRLELGILSYALKDNIPIDVYVERYMQTLGDVHADVFDGKKLYGHIFSGRNNDEIDLQLDIIRDPMQKIELHLDHEWTGSEVYDGDLYDGSPFRSGMVRSGIDFFYTEPFQSGEQRFIEIYIDPDEPESTKFSNIETMYGEVRSGLHNDYQFPFEVELFEKPVPKDVFIELEVVNEPDSTELSGEETYYGDVRSGLYKDANEPFDDNRFIELQTEKVDFNNVPFEAIRYKIIDIEPVDYIYTTDEFEVEIKEARKTNFEIGFDDEDTGSGLTNIDGVLSGDTTDSDLRSIVRSGNFFFDTYPFELKQLE